MTFSFAGRSSFLSLCVLAITSGSFAAAEQLVSPQAASRLGLVEAWQHQLPVGFGAEGIVDLRIQVSGDVKRTFVELVQTDAQPTGETAPVGSDVEANSAKADTTDKPAERVLARFSADDVDLSGTSLGVDEASRLARNEQRRLKRRGHETTIRQREVNLVRILVLTDRGRLETLDAETGRTLWATQFGNPRHEYGGVGSNDRFVVATNGTTAYVFDIAGGDLIREVTLTYPPGYPPAVVGEMAYIPGSTGTMEGIHCTDPDYAPYAIRTSGQVTSQMATAEESKLVAWSSDLGYTFVMKSDRTPEMNFRLDTSGQVYAPPAIATGDRLFIASDLGQVYCVHSTRRGQVIWNQPLGEPFYEPVFQRGDRILLRSSFGNLFALDANTGAPIWAQPAINVDQILAMAEERIYVTSLSGGVAVLDVETGNRLRVLSRSDPGVVLTNAETDRIYLVSRRGNMQCLRPEDSPLPEFRQLQIPKAKPEAEPEKDQPANPFGVADGGAADDDDDAGMTAEETVDDLFGSPDDGGLFGGDDENIFGSGESLFGE